MNPAPQAPSRPLTPLEEEELLLTAKTAVDHAVNGRPPRPSSDRPALQAPAMAFVTLTRGGELRGCIGNLEGKLPLIEVVAGCAAAVTRDSRFPPVVPHELPDLTVSISLLGGFREMTRPEEVEVGRHGLLIEKLGRRGLLLPRVAREMKLDRWEFLDLVCRKAGLAEGSWREGARVKIFTAREIPPTEP